MSAQKRYDRPPPGPTSPSPPTTNSSSSPQPVPRPGREDSSSLGMPPRPSSLTRPSPHLTINTSTGSANSLGRTPGAVGSGGSTSPGGWQESPSGTSYPRYVDPNSLVYTLPSFPDPGNTNPNAGGGSTIVGDEGGAAFASQPMPISKRQSSHDFHFSAAPTTPLSPTPRRGPGASVTGGIATSPIAIPTYNPHASAAESMSYGSPVLRSYRQHSFVAPVSPNSPGATVFPGSRPSMLSFASASHASLMDSGSPQGTGGVAGPVSPRPQQHNSGGGAGAGGPEPIHARFLEINGYPLGLENFGNTCFCNSVVQLMYHCTPLRLRLLELQDLYANKKGGAGFEEDTVLYHLCNLIAVMHKSNNRRKDKKREQISPDALLKCVRAVNPVFDNNMQQDAHEFAMFILNNIMDTERAMMNDPKNRALFMEEESKKKKSGASGAPSGLAFWKTKKETKSRSRQRHNSALNTTSGGGAGTAAAAAADDFTVTPLQCILQGQFGSLTACLECNSITARDEVFIDLSLETRQGSSLLHCLHHFGDPEYFYGNNKLRCDTCGRQVRAAKTIHVEQLPQYALLVHLKRFRYDVAKRTFTKKADHVALPMQMDVEEYETEPDDSTSPSAPESSRDAGNTSPSPSRAAGGAAEGDDSFKPAPAAIRRKLRGVARHKARFALTGFVAHIGEGPNLGHYFTCVRYGPQLWRRFDDDVVSTMTEREVQQYFGVPIDMTGVVTTTAYILLYERVQ